MLVRATGPLRGPTSTEGSGRRLSPSTRREFAHPPGRTGAERIVEFLNQNTHMAVAVVSPPDSLDLTDWSPDDYYTL